MTRRRKSTETYDFGVGRRESHDASMYYDRSLFDVTLDKKTVPVPPALSSIDDVFNTSAERMCEIADNSVALMVTSPPYHVGKEYDTDEGFPEYLQMMTKVLEETYRVLEPGGRAAINVAGLGRKPYVPLPDLISRICHDIGFMSRGEIIWVKAKGASGSCAWGSWMSPTNPTLRDLHEYVLVFSKGRFERSLKPKQRRELELPWESTITRDDFMECTLSVWYFQPASATRIGHPAPFPVELPRRLIELYTFRGDLVLDPFMGSGTTAVAAINTDRRFVGYENDREHGYFQKMCGRVAAAQAEAEVAP